MKRNSISLSFFGIALYQIGLETVNGGYHLMAANVPYAFLITLHNSLIPRTVSFKVDSFYNV